MARAGKTPPPTVVELQGLEQAVRSDPAGPKADALGKAYLGQGRAEDAARVLGRALTQRADDVPLRILCAQAHLAMKDLEGAQAHLVRAVKTDPRSADGFALLGQVLAARGDSARAKQMVERAMQLAPGRADLAPLLARVGGAPAPVARAAAEPLTPTVQDGHTDELELSDSAVHLATPTPTPVPAPVASKPAAPAPVASKPATAGPAAPVAAESPTRVRPVERPRLEAAPNKRIDLGAPDKLRSAALGDDFLPRLLGSGLLAIPNVEARARQVNEVARSRAGLRTLLRRGFVVVVIAGVALGGFFTYTYVARRQRESELGARLGKSSTLLASTRQADLAAASAELTSGLARVPADPLLTAELAQAQALELLWFGEREGLSAKTVDVELLGKLDLSRSAPARRAASLAMLALGLAEVDADPTASATRLDALFDEAKAALGDDPMFAVLRAWRLRQRGDDDGARALLEPLADAATTPPVALVMLGDLALDGGDPDGAVKRYEAVLAKTPGHTLAIAGRALARAELGGDPEAAMEDLNVALAKAVGARVGAYRDLAFALVWSQLEDFDKFAEAIGKAQAAKVSEPRFVARIALARLDRGQIDQARTVAGEIVAGDKGSVVVRLMRSDLALADGDAAHALELVGEDKTLRGLKLRGRALVDLGKAKEALADFEAAVALSSDDLTARAYEQLARLSIATADKDVAAADKAFEALASLARKAVSGLPRYVLGEANLVRGRAVDARRDFEASLEGDNPLAYRARTRLGGLYLDAGQAEPAGEAITAALAQATGYRPALAARGRLLVVQGKTAEGAKLLGEALADGQGTLTEELELTKALVTLGQTEPARAALERARKKGATPEQLAPLEGQVGIAPAPTP